MPDVASPLVTLRRATRDDSRRVWEWRNDPVARRASLTSAEIAYEEHARWFFQKLRDPKVRLFIATDHHGKGLGYVRFELSGQEAEMSVGIDPQRRGQGVGTAAITRGSEQLLATEPIQRIVARVRRDNPASIAVFERAGFVRRAARQTVRIDIYEMSYERRISD